MEYRSNSVEYRSNTVAKTSKLTWFKFFPGDWIVGTSGMSAAAKGAYIDMLCLQWSGVELPADLKALRRKLPNLTPSAYEELREHFTVGADGLLRNERLSREQEAAGAKSVNNSRSAATRWKPDTSAVAVCERNANAMRMHQVSVCERNAIREAEAEAETETEPELVMSCGTDSNPKTVRNINSTEPKKLRAKDPITWSPADGWTGITDADHAAWATAFPATKIDMELAKMGQWLASNPTKARKSLWRRFLTNWLSRCQEGGGSRQNGSTAFRRDESHIPDDCADNQRNLWFMPDGRTPRRVPIYRTKTGEDKFTEATT